MQAGIADHTRVCAYDRVGYGESEPSDAPRTLGTLTDELAATLEESGEPGPYVLVGHSYGGLVVALFAERHPELTAGVVLVDSSHPAMLEQLAEVPAILALQDAEIDAVRQQDPDAAPVAEYDVLDESLAEADAEIDGLDDLPVVVIAHGLSLEEWLPSEVLEAFALDQPAIDRYEEIWRGLQDDFGDLSSNSTVLVAENSSHVVFATDPGIVVDAAVGLLEAPAQSSSTSASATSIPASSGPASGPSTTA